MATILIVDDHSVHRDFLAALLDGAGHRLLMAGDGLEALEIAAAGAPDLLISDIMMPRMDGYQLVTRMRQEPALAAVPVIFYTSSYSTAEAASMARACGVQWVLSKPSPPQLILNNIYEALRLPLPQRAPAAPLAPGRHFASVDEALVRDLYRNGSGAPAGGDELSMNFQSIGLRLTALIDMGIELASEREPQSLLESGCRIGRHIGVARMAVAVFLGADGRSYANCSTRGVSAAEDAAIRRGLPTGALFAQALAQRKPRRLHGLGGGDGELGLPPGHPPLDSLLVVPIASARKGYGWIYLGDKLGADRFSSVDEEVLAAVAAQMAVAYENSLLMQHVASQVQALEREAAERSAMAAQLQQSETQFRQLAENINEVFFLLDAATGSMLYISPAYARIWGRSCASLYADPLSWIAAIHEDDRSRIAALYAADASAGFDYSYRIVQPGGAVRTIHARGFPIRDDAGKVYRIAGIAEDTSDYVRALQAVREREAGLGQAQRVSGLAHVISRPDGALESWSATMPAMLGVAEAGMPARIRDWTAFVHPEDRAAFLACCVGAGRSGRHGAVDYRLRRADDSVLRVHQVLEPLPAQAGGGAPRWISTLQDVTEAHEQGEKLARIRRIHAVQSGVNAAIVRVRDRAALLRAASRVAMEHGAFSMAWVGLVGERGDDGRIIDWLGDPALLAGQQALLAAAMAAGSGHPACRAAREAHAVVCNDIAREPALADTAAQLRRAGHGAMVALPLLVDGRAVAILVLFAAEAGFFDRAELALLDDMAADLSFGLSYIDREERLNFLAYYDALTGLPNRTLFLDRLNQRLLGGAGEFVVVVLNLDRFGQLNDALGRKAGDAVLRMVAARLRAALGEAACVARLVNDTFALVLDSAPGHFAVARSEAQVLGLLEHEIQLDGQGVHVSARAGLALSPADGADAETLLKCAELALKSSKAAQLRVMYYAAQMNAASAARLELESALHAALETAQFVLHYQPRVDLISGRIVSAEALIRWQHPRRGLVGPVQFIPLCEETGLIVPLSDWVIDTVCAQQAAWLAQGVEIVPVAVNLSALQFLQGNLMQTIAAALRRHGVEQRYLEFELTESMVMADLGQAERDLAALKAVGAKLSLDDFGTGYSSLAYLQRLPFDYVKIDRSFIANLTSNTGDAAIVGAVIAVAHSLQLEVVAEGVETEGQLRALRRLQCDQLQGYFFSPGVAADAFGSMLRADKQLEHSP